MSVLAHLPAELSIVTLTPVLPTLGGEHVRIHEGSVRDRPCSSSVVVAEGIPPLPQKRYKNGSMWTWQLYYQITCP